MEGHDVCGNIEFDSVAILRSNISGPDSRRLGQDYRKLEDRMKSFNFWPPGMPVESYIVTGSRTFLQYLFDPITISMRRAFREE